MATFTKQLLSQSTGGIPILVGTGTGGTLIHSTETSSTSLDEVWVYANNVGTSEADLTVMFGGNAAGQPINVSISSGTGLVLVIPGLLLSGDGSNERSITASSSTENFIYVSGYVNRIS